MEENLSLIEFYKLFPNEKSCLDHIEKVRWLHGLYCPFCGYKEKIYNLNTPVSPFKCGRRSCGKKFSHRVGTIFQSSHIPLTIWFYLFYFESINKKNTSSHQMARNLGITQKTMWGMQQLIRKSALQQQNLKLKGVVEVDECFISKGKWVHNWGAFSTRKAPILGLVERGGKVIIQTIPDRSRDTLLNIILNHVTPGSTIYTDAHPSYQNLSPLYNHDYVNHSAKEYVRGNIHTNTIENVWSMFKKSIRNAHHHISDKHSQLYCDQTAFRFNNRHLYTYERFNELLRLSMQGSIIFRGNPDRSDKLYLQ